jgi:hypothetical protein
MLDTLFTGDLLWFSVPAFLGTAVFALRLALLAIGGHAHDLPSTDVIDVHHTDPTEAFKIVSVQSVIAFLRGFGWGGLAARQSMGWEMAGSAAMGIVAGCAAVWLIGWLMRAVYSLQSSGNISINAALGAEGEVYATSPGTGTGAGPGPGQVKVTIRDRQRVYNAVSEGGEIATGTRVRVVRVNENNTITVRPA